MSLLSCWPCCCTLCRRGLLWKIPLVLLSLGLAAAGGYYGYKQYEEHKDKKGKDSKPAAKK